MSDTAADRDRVGYGAALRSREFCALFAGQLISTAGTSAAAVALSVLVYSRTNSAFLSSLTFALGFLPYVVGGGLFSSAVDRMPPRRLVTSCDAISAAAAAAMAIPGMPIPALLALLVCLGMLSSVASGSRGALVRATVAPSAYVPARSLLRISSQTAQIGGNVLGGVLLVAFGTSGALLVNAATFAVSFLLVRFLVANHALAGSVGQMGVLRDSLRGVREVFAHAGLARLLLLGWLVPTFSVAPEALGAPYVSAHHGSPALVGWWLAALPIGTIAGDLFGVRFIRQTLQQRLVVPVAAAGFLPYLFFVVDPPVWVAIALLVLSGAFGMYSLGLDGRIRDAAPDHLFARTMALNTAGLMTLQGLGFAFAGAVAQLIGPAGAIALAGVCGLVAVAVLRSLPRPEPSPVYP